MNQTPSTRRLFGVGKRWLPELGLLLAVLCVHGIICLLDFKVWDGWWEEWCLTHGHQWVICRLYQEAGVRLEAPFTLLLGWFPNPNLACKILSFLIWYLTAVTLYRIALLSGFVSGAEAFAVATLSVVLPFYALLGEVSTFIYTACPLLFNAACLCFLFSQSAQRSRLRIAFRMAALAIFFLSFALNSLLAYHFGFIALLYFQFRARHTGSSAKNYLVFFTSHADVILLPFIFWIWKQLFSSPYGMYESYNEPHLNAPVILLLKVMGTIPYLLGGSISQLVNPFGYHFGFLLFFFLVVLVTLLLPKYQAEIRKPSLGLLLYGYGLLVLAVLPYLAAGKGMALFEWPSRTLILMGPPAAVTLVALFRFAAAASLLASRLFWPLLLSIVIGSGFCYLRSYLCLEAATARDTAVIYQMEGNPHFFDYGLFEVNPLFKIEKTPLHPQTIILSYMLAYARGKLDFLALNPEEQREVSLHPNYHTRCTLPEEEHLLIGTTMGYSFDKISHPENQATLIIETMHPNFSPEIFALHYLYFRLFLPSKLEEWNRTSVRVTLTSIH